MRRKLPARPHQNFRRAPAEDFRRAWIHATLRRKQHGGHFQRSSPSCAASDSLPTGFRVCTSERGHAVTPFTRRCDFGHKSGLRKSKSRTADAHGARGQDERDKGPRDRIQEVGTCSLNPNSRLAFRLLRRSPTEQEGLDWRVDFTIWYAGSGCDPWHWRRRRRGRECICEACEQSLRRPGENT
jgi:hypothetical protein